MIREIQAFHHSSTTEAGSPPNAGEICYIQRTRAPACWGFVHLDRMRRIAWFHVQQGYSADRNGVADVSRWLREVSAEQVKLREVCAGDIQNYDIATKCHVGARRK